VRRKSRRDRGTATVRKGGGAIGRLARGLICLHVRKKGVMEDSHETESTRKGGLSSADEEKVTRITTSREVGGGNKGREAKVRKKKDMTITNWTKGKNSRRDFEKKGHRSKRPSQTTKGKRLETVGLRVFPLV